MYYLNARYYDADIARFISEDTYRGDPKDPFSLNLYTYVNNEPMMYDDPTGHMPKWLKKAAKVTFKVAKFAVLDDIMTLANPKATLGQRIMAGVSLLPAGKIIKVAQVAIKVTKTVKATNAVSKNVSLVRLTSSKSGPTMASRVSTKKSPSFVKSSNRGTGNSLNPKNIHFMQSSIKNKTGDHTVLGNADALKSGKLSPRDLKPINVWKDDAGKTWTLDHRRLAAFRIAGTEKIPVQWATKQMVNSQMWKMTTKNGGNSIKLKLGDGNNLTIK